MEECFSYKEVVARPIRASRTMGQAGNQKWWFVRTLPTESLSEAIRLKMLNPYTFPGLSMAGSSAVNRIILVRIQVGEQAVNQQIISRGLGTVFRAVP